MSDDDEIEFIPDSDPERHSLSRLAPMCSFSSVDGHDNDDREQAVQPFNGGGSVTTSIAVEVEVGVEEVVEVVTDITTLETSTSAGTEGTPQSIVVDTLATAIITSCTVLPPLRALPWHNLDQQQIRVTVTTAVTDLLVKRRPTLLQEQQTLVRKTALIEQGLYDQASSLNEYEDIATIRERMHRYAAEKTAGSSSKTSSPSIISPTTTSVSTPPTSGTNTPDVFDQVNEVSLLLSPSSSEGVAEETISIAASSVTPVTPSAVQVTETKKKGKPVAKKTIVTTPTPLPLDDGNITSPSNGKRRKL
jgi:hypothetical protein